MIMNRAEYEAARRLYRDNGRYSYRWMSREASLTIAVCVDDARDPLAERSWIRANFGQAGIARVVRQDAPANPRFVLSLPFPADR